MATYPLVTDERAASINGVEGRMFAATVGGARYHAGTLTNQKWCATRPVKGYGRGARLTVWIRFDDNCRNGHNTFAITGEVRVPNRRDFEACGCLHEDIAATFPELAPLIKWHLVSTDGPMHYVANTVYHASNRDHWGKLAGEPRQFGTVLQFGDNPIKHKLSPAFMKFLEESAAHNGRERFGFLIHDVSKQKTGASGKPEYYQKWTFGGFGEEWYHCPFDTEQEAVDFLFALQNCNPQFVKVPTAWGEGKERNLDAAREAAAWPDATDADLMQERPELEKALAARLPGLLAAFRTDMEAAGFLWEAPALTEA